MGTFAYAQDPPQSTPPVEKPSDAPKTSVIGCLTKGTGPGEYTITDMKSGEKLPFNAPAQIEKFLNQTVRLTGTMINQGDNKVFRPEAINQVSATCEKGQ